MQIDLEIKNYRGFAESKPARFTIRDGFTAFVGPNNSGKSSLLRFFVEFRALFPQLSSPTGNFMGALQLARQAFGQADSVKDPAELFTNTTNGDLQIIVAVSNDAPRQKDSVTITVPRGTNTWIANTNFTAGLSDRSKLQWNRTVLTGGRYDQDMSTIFEAFKSLSNTVYIPSFRNAINVGGTANYFDIQTGQHFVSTWDEYKNGRTVRNREAATQVTEDIRSIFGFQSLEINPSNDNTTLLLVINRRSYRLDEVGSGIAQFVLSLINVAVKQPSFVLIDEPELNLHPALQLRFLTALGSHANSGVLFATHNYGLARAAAEQIYTISKDADDHGEIRPLEDTPRLSQLLGELSFAGHRELGFDKVLLVEGFHDVKTVQQFLRQYGRDGKVVLLPLGGSTLINEGVTLELQEIKRICEQVYALIDSEKASEDAPLDPQREAFVKACADAGIDCRVLSRRAMENYLSDRAIKAVKGEKYSSLQPYERLNDLPLAWSKAENWRIAREMSVEELRETDLGQFLASL